MTEKLQTNRALGYAEYLYRDSANEVAQVAQRASAALESIRAYDPELTHSRWQWFDGRHGSVLVWVGCDKSGESRIHSGELQVDRFGEARLVLTTGDTYFFAGLRTVNGVNAGEIPDDQLDAICSSVTLHQTRALAEV